MIKNKTSYLFFRLSKEIFAIDVFTVVETIEMQELTPIPETPEFMKGVMVFRGDVLPVIDLALKLGMDESPKDTKKYIIVVDYKTDEKKQRLGMIVDKMLDVVSLSELDIDNFPELGSKYNIEFISGIVRYNGDITIILNINKILSSVEVDIIKKATENGNLIEENPNKEE